MKNIYVKFTKLLRLLLPFKYRVNVGAGFTHKGRVFLVNNGNISIGKNVHINSSLRSNPVFGVERTSIVCNKNASIVIGDDVGISNTTIFCENKITIGNRTLIGSGVKIWDLDFHSINHSVRLKKGDRGQSSPVFIGNDCFIGAGSIILKGVSLGEKVVIGAGSVVTKNVPSGEIWAGNPARKISAKV